MPKLTMTYTQGEIAEALATLTRNRYGKPCKVTPKVHTSSDVDDRTRTTTTAVWVEVEIVDTDER